VNRKLTIISLLILIIVFSLTACEKAADDESYDETTITVDKKGQISETIVEAFNKDYYSTDELTTEFNAVIQKYNAQADDNDAAVLKEIKEENGNVYVKLDFKNHEAYEAVQNETFFYGTIGQAYDSGYNMDVTLKGLEAGDKIEKVQIMGMSDKHIVIFSESAKIKLYSPILYVSANVDVVSDKVARSSSESGSGLCYIILEK